MLHKLPVSLSWVLACYQLFKLQKSKRLPQKLHSKSTRKTSTSWKQVKLSSSRPLKEVLASYYCRTFFVGIKSWTKYDLYIKQSRFWYPADLPVVLSGLILHSALGLQTQWAAVTMNLLFRIEPRQLVDIKFFRRGSCNSGYTPHNQDIMLLGTRGSSFSIFI